MRKLAAALCCASIFVVLMVYQLRLHQDYLYEVIDDARENETVGRTKTILTWTTFFGKKDWLPRNISELGCTVSECVVTSDRDSLKDSAAIVFHWRDVNLQDLPPASGDQLWILYNKESPMHTPRNVLAGLSSRINWTVTYRRDSDFTSAYGRIMPGKDQYAIGNKTALVAWLVSNCNTPSRREDYVNELSHHVKVDKYGNCGKKYCPRIPASSCYAKLGKKYRFYLSFENSICKDYATEKLFYAMKNGMVPVVFGGADYSDILPPGSYINTQDYESPKVLASYLQRLSKNEEEYRSYFKWRDTSRVDLVPYRWLCDVCQRLHENTVTVNKNRLNLEKWWYQESNCKLWKNGKLLAS